MQRTILLVLLLALMLLTACSNDQQTPPPVNITPVTDDQPAATVPTPTTAASPVAEQPTGASAATVSPVVTAPTPVDVMEVARTATAAVVYAQPDTTAARLGELPADTAVIVTRALDGWYEIIFMPEVSSHGWVQRETVQLGSSDEPATPIAQSTSVPATATAAPQPAVVTTPRPATRASGSTLAGKLVFQDRSGGTIYVMNADGSGLRRLTTGFEPALSPDGQRVAFTRWDEPRGLWVINVDGSGEQFLFGANAARSPTWAPDGGAIIFERLNKSRICRSTPFGCLTDDEWRARFGGDCITTPFGPVCIGDFTLASVSETNLTRYDLATATARDLPSSVTAAAPGHHPTQDRVVYRDDDGLAATATTGDDAPQRLVQAPNLLGPAIFSADGQWLYGSRRAQDHWDIWRWPAGGGSGAALTAPPGLRNRSISSYAPAVSPDGKHVVFLSNREGPWQLWVMNADGSNQRPLAAEALAGITFQVDFNNERIIDWGQ